MRGNFIIVWNLGSEGSGSGIGMHCIECEDPVVPEGVMGWGSLEKCIDKFHETAVQNRIVEKNDRMQSHLINHAENPFILDCVVLQIGS